MDEPVRVLVLGVGQMGAGIMRLLQAKPGVVLAGAYEPRRRDPAVQVGVRVGDDLAQLIEDTRPAVAIQATCSRLEDAAAEIATLLEHGVHVISIAEEMAYPACSDPGLARRLDALARDRGVTVLGTGVNPGFVLDLLVVTLTGVCQRVDRITGRRVNDLSPYGPTVLSSQGVGLSPEAFAAGVADGTVAGHLGFPESISMIAAALGWRLDRIEQSRAPIIAKVRRQTPFAVVEPGCSAGCLHTAVGYVAGRPTIRLIHPQQLQPHVEGVATGDSITIEGEPAVRLEGSPEIPGGKATVALAVNLIPRVLAATPGLKSMIDLPVPAAMGGELRARSDGGAGRMRHG